MKIAIVGRSNLTDSEHDKAFMIIETLIERLRKEGHSIITGDAAGVDGIVRSFEGVHMYKSSGNNWKSYKDRNIRIAKNSDYVYSISTRVHLQPCYHCGEAGHERTGGCWTLKYARGLGKRGEVIVI